MKLTQDSTIRGAFFYHTGKGNRYKVFQIVWRLFKYRYRAFDPIVLGEDMELYGDETYWPKANGRVDHDMRLFDEIFLVPSGDPIWNEKAAFYLTQLCNKYGKTFKILEGEEV